MVDKGVRVPARTAVIGTRQDFQADVLSKSDWWLNLLNSGWQGAFATGEQTIIACQVNRVYYKPEKESCRVYLKIKVGDANGRFLGDQLLFAHFFPPHISDAHWSAIQAQRWTQPEFGDAVCYIAEHGLIIWAYPNDPQVPGVALLADSEQVLAELQANQARLGLAPTQTPHAIQSAQQTKYVISHRCGYLYDVANVDGSTVQLYAKAYREKTGLRASTLWQQVWDSPARQQGKLTLPHPYYYDDERHILWQAVLAGRPLAKIVADVDLPALALQVGAQLAALHSQTFVLEKGKTLAEEQAELTNTLPAIEKSLPSIAQRCQQVYEQLMSSPEAARSVPLVPVHASFKPSHVLVDNGRCALIDFDGMVLGDPGYDLGRFIAHLRGNEAKGKLATAVVNETVANFCRAYNEVAHHPVSQARIDWFTASLIVSSHVNKMVKRLYKAFNRLDDEQVHRLLALAEQAAGTGHA